MVEQSAPPAGSKRHERNETPAKRRIEFERLDGWWCESYNGNNGWAIGSEIKVAPDHVRVEAYHGEADNGGIKNPAVTVLDGSSPAEGEGNYI